jgi:hypothetical protein
MECRTLGKMNKYPILHHSPPRKFKEEDEGTNRIEYTYTYYLLFIIQNHAWKMNGRC